MPLESNPKIWEPSYYVFKLGLQAGRVAEEKHRCMRHSVVHQASGLWGVSRTELDKTEVVDSSCGRCIWQNEFEFCLRH